MKPHLLVTNDDGIESAFLHRLVAALLPKFKVSVAAPAFEQSWIGRAISRHQEIEVLCGASHFPAEVTAWAINGTPTDCVNIALGHLLERPADAVVSGINIGYNTTEDPDPKLRHGGGRDGGRAMGLPRHRFQPMRSLCRL
jgi:5'-nucleotidase